MKIDFIHLTIQMVLNIVLFIHDTGFFFEKWSYEHGGKEQTHESSQSH